MTKTYKDGQTIGSAEKCIHCGKDLEKGITGDKCRDAEACIVRMVNIEFPEGTKF